MQRGKRGYSGLQWTNIIAEGLRTVYPYCSFAFKRHRVKAEGSTRPGPAFWCLGYCRFEDCPITVTVTLQKKEDLKATVNFQGVECVHNKDTKTRPVRAENRNKLGLENQNQLPRAKYLELLSKIEDDVIRSGCRDEAPNPQVLRNISYEIRQKSRCHKNETLSLEKMVANKDNNPEEVLQHVILHPKGVYLWSKRGIEIFNQRCQEDIVYLDATGSIMKKKAGSPPTYVYELVVRNPKKGSSPLTVGTCLTCDHTTASVTSFLLSFMTNVAKTFGSKGMHYPKMVICDGSMVLMQSICLAFAGKKLHETINHYYKIATGKGKKEDFEVPILHRCLSHVMKNAKDICKK